MAISIGGVINKNVDFVTIEVLITFGVLGAASGSFLPEAVVWYNILLRRPRCG